MWQKFIEQQPGRIFGKVKQRLQELTLLAVRLVEREIGGCPKRYTYAELANMVGVTVDNWRKWYQGFWREILELCTEIYSFSLQQLMKRKSDN
ncbi:bacteriophage antitermination protein Q [Sodalis glossinidius]|uniref:bacteriophage antitermination protein Q n=1 Tax=Sodalis glossinidius TaxID=63612 RepID=UPI0002E4749E|nr:bacteriophage antitermination protein Q [Sodalis glossinidius]